MKETLAPAAPLWNAGSYLTDGLLLQMNSTWWLNLVLRAYSTYIFSYKLNKNQITFSTGIVSASVSISLLLLQSFPFLILRLIQQTLLLELSLIGKIKLILRSVVRQVVWIGLIRVQKYLEFLPSTLYYPVISTGIRQGVSVQKWLPCWWLRAAVAWRQAGVRTNDLLLLSRVNRINLGHLEVLNSGVAGRISKCSSN